MSEKPSYEELEKRIFELKQVVSERDKTLEALHENERYLDNIINTIADLIFVKNREHRWVLLNDAFCQFMGHHREELLGKSDHDFFPKEEADVFWAKDEIVFTSGKANINEEKITDAKGEVHTIVTQKRLYTDDKNKQFIVGIISDITDRKTAENALRESEFRFKALHNASFGGIVIHDKGKIIDCNQGLSEITGYPYDELIGTDGLRLIAPDSLEEVVGKMMSDAEEPYEVEGIRKDGSIYPLYLQSKLIPYKGRTVRVGEFRDITEQKKAKQRLQESEEKARIFVENTPLPVAMFDKNMCYIMVSKRWLFDYKLDDQNLIGRSHYDVFPEIGDEWKDDHQRVLNGEIYKNDNDKFIREDGSVQWLRYELRPWYKIDKSIGGLVMFTEDITARKLAEDTLQQNYIQLQTIYKTLPVIIWSLDKKGIFTLSEGKELNTLGLKPGQVVGLSAFDLYRDNPLIIKNIKTALNGKSCEYESEVEGTVYHSLLKPFFGDKKAVLGLNGIAVNVTEKRKVENEIRNLRNYLSNIIDSMPSLIVGVDSNCAITQWNKKVEKTTGISAKDARGKSIFNLLPQVAFEKKKIIQSIQTRQVVQEQKRSNETKNGLLYEDLTIYPLIANGVEGAVIRIDDVTDKVRLEEMMIQSEKMLSVGGLAAGMAHEINNPLAGIIQNINVLSNRLTSKTIPANLKAAELSGITIESINKYMDSRGIPLIIKAIAQSGLRVASIVENMLSFARKSDSSFSSHSPSDLLDKVLELASTDFNLKKQYDFKSISIQKEYQDHLPMIVCETSKIQQVLLNILNNGAYAMFARGKNEESPDPKFILRLSHSTEPNMLQIEIEDNGMGMDETTRKKIFEPFFTTKPVGEGTGLGLSVSYFIITENHGGTMDVVSEKGKGTKFIICLPLER